MLSCYGKNVMHDRPPLHLVLGHSNHAKDGRRIREYVPSTFQSVLSSLNVFHHC